MVKADKFTTFKPELVTEAYSSLGERCPPPKEATLCEKPQIKEPLRPLIQRTFLQQSKQLKNKQNEKHCQNYQRLPRVTMNR